MPNINVFNLNMNLFVTYITIRIFVNKYVRRFLCEQISEEKSIVDWELNNFRVKELTHLILSPLLVFH